MKAQVEDESSETTPGKAFHSWNYEFKSAGSRWSSSSSSRAFWVEEKLVVQNSHLLKSSAILKECSKIINEFKTVCSKTAYEREWDYGNRPIFKWLKISYENEEEIK